MVSFNASVTPTSHFAAHLLRRSSTRQSQPTQTKVQAAEATSSSQPGNEPPDFRKLFTGVTTPITTQPDPTGAAPTAESVFGADPWVTNPTGMGPAGEYSFNPIYFATPQTAAKVAQMLGGTVVASNQLVNGGPFSQQQPNQMVKMPDGRLVNPGLVAAFYTHGYSQSYIDQLVAGVVSSKT